MPDISLRRVDQSTAKPKLIVIFVHGLGGDPVSTWCHEGGEADGYFWPRGIAEKIEGCAVFTLGYPADKAVWNTGWPIATAAVSVLDKLMSSQRLRECGDVPIAFVCHSLGGLIIKKLVVTAHLDRQQHPAKGKFLDRISGVAFLATPHSGSIIANIVSTAHWFVSNSLTDLKASDANLLDLSHSYRDRIANGEVRIRHRVYYETEAYGVFKIVTPASADLGVPGARPIGVKRHHMSICKPLDEDDTVYEGVLTFLQDEVLQPRTPSQNDKLDVLLRLVSQKESVPLETLRAILSTMGEVTETATAQEIADKLTSKAIEFRVLTERLNRLSNADPAITRLRQAAAAELVEGRFLRTDTLLAEAEALDLSGVEDLESLAQQKRLSAAESRAERASAAQLRTNPDGYREAAYHYGEAARIAFSADSGIAREYTLSKGQALRALGDEFGINSALIEAIDHFRAMLRATELYRDAHYWASIQNQLGITLGMIGARESGTARLEEAVMAFRAALEVTPRDSAPIKWAATQNNLGAALNTLGARQSGSARLEEAAIAYRAALEERTRKRDPIAWALTQNNLGLVLAALGGRETGCKRFEEAIIVYHLALEERKRDRAPLDWAATQNNLGNALFSIGVRESGTARLKDAVVAYNLALEERKRDRIPLDWAMTQHNLGNALGTLGTREKGTSNLEKAMTAHGMALEEYKQDRVPLKWAMSFGSQGVVMRAIAERSCDLALAQQATNQIAAAFFVMTTGAHAPHAAFYQEQLIMAQELVAKLGG